MQNNKIVLLYPPVILKGRYAQLATGSEVYPQGLCILGAVTRNHGMDPVIIDAKAKGYDEDITIQKILDENPKYLGITASTMLIHSAAVISEKIKLKNPDIITIVGGPHITAVPEKTMNRFKYIDIGVVGEGEITLPELITAIENKELLQNVKGIIYRNNENLIKTEPRPYISNLDDVPFPAWDLIPNLTDEYQQVATRVDKLPCISISTSRGCPYQCTFCARNVFGNLCRSYSSDRVIEMIKRLIKEYHVKSIAIEDENFVVFKKRLKEVCQRIIDENIKISWSCSSRVDQADLESLQLMKRAGCYSISYGIESGSEKILKNIKKGITKEKIYRGLELTRQAGIESRGYFIIGLPGETMETIEETRKFALSLPLDYFQMSFLNAFPGTEISVDYEKYGTYNDNWDEMNIWTPNFIPHGLTQEILENESKKTFRTFYFRPKVIFKYILKSLNPRYFIKYLRDGFKVFKFLLSNKG